jgi:hypothetical protein
MSRNGASRTSKVEARMMSSALFKGFAGCNGCRKLSSAGIEAGLAIVWSEEKIRNAFLPDK